MYGKGGGLPAPPPAAGSGGAPTLERSGVLERRPPPAAATGQPGAGGRAGGGRGSAGPARGGGGHDGGGGGTTASVEEGRAITFEGRGKAAAPGAGGPPRPEERRGPPIDGVGEDHYVRRRREGHHVYRKEEGHRFVVGQQGGGPDPVHRRVERNGDRGGGGARKVCSGRGGQGGGGGGGGRVRCSGRGGEGGGGGVGGGCEARRGLSSSAHERRHPHPRDPPAPVASSRIVPARPRGACPPPGGVVPLKASAAALTRLPLVGGAGSCGLVVGRPADRPPEVSVAVAADAARVSGRNGLQHVIDQ